MARRTIASFTTLAAAGGLLLGAAGCDWTAFDDLEECASFTSIERPDGFDRGVFGSVVYGYTGTPAGSSMPESRLAISGGPDSPTAIFVAEGPQGQTGLERPTFFSCEKADSCGTDANEGEGVAVGFMQNRQFGPMMLGQFCVLVGVPGANDEAGVVNIRCENVGSFSESVAGPMPGSRFGSSIASLRPGSTIGGAVAGAPNADGGKGAVLRLELMGSGLRMGFPTDEDPVMTGGQLGASLATGVSEAGGSPVDLIAAGAPGQAAAFLWVEGENEDGDAAAVPCDPTLVARTGAGFGGVLALGDFDGNGVDDLAVSAPANTMMRPDRVVVYLFEAGANGCPSSAREIELDCPATLPENAPPNTMCATGVSAFGAALTAADLDGDGTDDLVVGAPGMIVGGQSDAGAVLVYRGQTVVAGGGPDSVLGESDPQTGARLGAALGSVLIDGREEIVSGAPGISEALVMWCSGIAGDQPGEAGLDECCRPTGR